MNGDQPDAELDDLMRRAMAARDPSRGKEMPPYTMTPAEMRQQAQRRIDAAAIRRQVRRQPSFWLWRQPLAAVHRLRRWLRT